MCHWAPGFDKQQETKKQYYRNIAFRFDFSNNDWSFLWSKFSCNTFSNKGGGLENYWTLSKYTHVWQRLKTPGGRLAEKDICFNKWRCFLWTAVKVFHRKNNVTAIAAKRKSIYRLLIVLAHSSSEHELKKITISPAIPTKRKMQV